MINRKVIIDKVLENVELCYDNVQAELVNIGINHRTEGEIRYAAGELVEKVLQSIFDAVNDFLPEKIISKVGKRDGLTKEIVYKGQRHVIEGLQVDRHVWYKGERIAFIENKTYLDACYYDRALADFRKIVHALIQRNENPKKCLYIVFAGQKAASDNTLLAYEGDFWNDTKTIMNASEGIEPISIFFLKNSRSAAKPLYKIKHPLDFDNIIKFVNIILDKIDTM